MKRRIGRCAAAMALAVTGGVQAVYAERFTCVLIQPGDTAAHLAWRLTGDVAHRHARWFQIVNPTTSRFVPKREYARILPGWRACVAEGRVTNPSIPAKDGQPQPA